MTTVSQAVGMRMTSTWDEDDEHLLTTLCARTRLLDWEIPQIAWG